MVEVVVGYVEVEGEVWLDAAGHVGHVAHCVADEALFGPAADRAGEAVVAEVRVGAPL